MSSGVTNTRTITASEAQVIGTDFANALRSAGAGQFSAQRGGQELAAFIQSNPNATPTEIANYANTLTLQRANTSRPNEARVIRSIVDYSATKALYLVNPQVGNYYQPVDVDRAANPDVARQQNIRAERENNLDRSAFLQLFNSNSSTNPTQISDPTRWAAELSLTVTELMSGITGESGADTRTPPR
jgi:hypothetical protein